MRTEGCFQSFQFEAGAREVMKIETCQFHCHSAVFPFISDKCLWRNLIEAAMFSPVWFAKETLGTGSYWAFSDCWHTYLAIGMLM